MASKDLFRIMEWIPFESRPMDEEERKQWSEQFGYDIPKEEAVIFFSTLPEDGQEVLVCNRNDRFLDDEEACNIPNDCPIIELPEHGDLVDLDAFRAEIKKEDTYQNWLFRKMLEKQPVIVPANKEEHNG